MSLIIPDKRLDTEIDCIKFPYRLDDFQINGIHGINNDANILITAHTSAGKSTLAEYAVAKSLSLNKKVIYTSPIKTLSNQKYYDFKKTIDNIGIITGDIKLNPEADCLIMTTEILRNKLDSDDPIFDDLHCVIFDEVHYFNDPDRGFVWEECLAKLPKNIILVMLSATIDKAEEFGKWICDLKEKDTYLIGTQFRPVPLTHYLYTDDHLLETYSSSNLNKVNLDKAYAFYKSKEKQSHKANTKGKLESISKYLNKRNLFPSIFFSFSRKKCNEYCSFLRSGSGFLTPDEKNEINKYLQQIFSTNLKIYKDLPSTVEIIECIKYGVAVHHSGLLPVQKEIIEILFLRGLIKILFATETFAVGVNMPTKTVVFTELSKYDGISEFPRVLRSDEFLQMSGRAGRRGKDDKGYVVYFPLKKIEDKSDIVRLYKGKPRKLVSQYNEKNNLLIRLMNNKKNIKDFYLSTMFGNEIKKTTVEIDDEIDYLNGLLEKNIDFNLSDGEKSIIDNFNEINKKLEEKPNQKQRKKLLKELDDIKMDFTYNIEQYLLENETKEKIRGNIERLKNENVLVNNEIDNQISFSSNLYKLLGIIDENNNLSMYGKLVANLTNCSEILLGKLIASNFFAKLDNKTIVIILSLLIDDRGEEEYDYKKYLNKEENDAINHVLDFNDEIDYAYQELKTDSNINLSSSFIVPIKWWYEKKDFVEIIRLYNNFDGNFVKNIFKIRDICQEIIKISEIFMMGDLLEKMNEILNVIIYDLCEFNSLYIHHYDLVKKITEKK